MVRDKLKQYKQLLQTLTRQKSIKVSIDGKVEIVFRFKPNELLVSDIDAVTKLENETKLKVESITSIKYRVASMQKQPAFCYNTYARVLRISSESSRDKVKKYLPYFLRIDNGSFVKQSYSDITIVLLPSVREEFETFLYDQL